MTQWMLAILRCAEYQKCNSLNTFNAVTKHASNRSNFEVASLYTNTGNKVYEPFSLRVVHLSEHNTLNSVIYSI